MRVLIVEDNLLWSARLSKSLTVLGYEPVIESTMPSDSRDAGIAIVNLGSKAIDAKALVPLLKGWGVKVIAHAGHKEKDLHALGAELECDALCTNGELTWRPDRVLAQFV